MTDTDLNTLRNTDKLYSFDQTWAQEELAHRLAVKQELDDLGNNIARLDYIAHSH